MALTCCACGADNPAGKKFCGDCGTALENRCPQCGADHVRISGRVVLQIAAHVGTRDGGAFEMPVVAVAVYDAETRLQEVDIYDFEQISEAQARFEERCAERAL